MTRSPEDRFRIADGIDGAQWMSVAAAETRPWRSRLAGAWLAGSVVLIALAVTAWHA